MSQICATKKNIAVLLSTYNGIKYLPEQMKSLEDQLGPYNIEIFIRDDGSTDLTVSYLRSLKLKFPLHIIEGNNLGPVRSFFELIINCPLEFDYYAFCDQDDVWDKDKIQIAVNSIAEIKSPALYCSALRLVDIKLKNIGYFQHQKPIGFPYCLFINVATGCTCLINKDLLLKLRVSSNPACDVIMHDWWIYLVASIFGKIIYDENSYISYRQHETNYIGVKRGVDYFLKKLMGCFTKKSNVRFRQAETLLNKYSEDITDDKIKLNMIKFIAGKESFYARIKYVLILKREIRFSTRWILSYLKFLLV